MFKFNRKKFVINAKKSSDSQELQQENRIVWFSCSSELRWQGWHYTSTSTGIKEIHIETAMH